MSEHGNPYPSNSSGVLVLLTFALTMAAIAILFFNVNTSQKQIAEASLNGKARGEVGLCIFSVSPTVRTPAYVKGCYDEVEARLKVKVTRYGDGK